MTPGKWIASLAIGAAAAAGFIAIMAQRAVSDRKASLAAMSQQAETRHGTLEYAAWGSGPPVLVLHGAGGGFDQGRLLAKAVGGSGFRWIAISRFGYLGSDMPEDPSTTAQAEAVVDLLDQIGIRRVRILAMSGGVPPALKFAELYPDRTARMALLSSAPFTPFRGEVEDRPMPTWVYSRLLASDTLYWLLTKAARQQLMAAFDARPDLRTDPAAGEAAFVEHLVDGFLPGSARLAGIANEGAAVDPAATYNLPAITAPVLVFHARDDGMNPYPIAEALAEGIPDARLAAYDTGGHLLLGHHEAIARELGPFFRAD